MKFFFWKGDFKNMFHFIKIFNYLLMTFSFKDKDSDFF